MDHDPEFELADPFSIGVGPFRRFSGGDTEHERRFASVPRVLRHLSLFDERVAFAESLAWLKQLRFKELEGHQRSHALLDALRFLINQSGLLPNGVHLGEVTSDDVLFVDSNDARVPVEQLSDGYRSILSLTFELIRQMSIHYSAEMPWLFDDNGIVIPPGIVLIDEVDAHLHPRWQRQIGVFLRTWFPNIQFVVTTHSPLICQAATADTDSIYRLQRPGTDEQAHRVTGSDLNRLLYGDLTDAYATEAMGEIERSDKAQALVDKLGVLNRKEVDTGLSNEEQQEQRRLRSIFGWGAIPGEASLIRLPARPLPAALQQLLDDRQASIAAQPDSRGRENARWSATWRVSRSTSQRTIQRPVSASAARS